MYDGVLHEVPTAPSSRMRFHLKTQTFCRVFMSRPHENDENDVSFSMKTQTFENALQSGKIWKRNSIGFVWTGRIHWKRKLLKTIGHVISVPVHLHSKSKDGEYRQRTYCCFYWHLAPWLWIGSWMFMLINLNNAFYTCVIEGWKRFQSLSSFPCGRVKRSCGCNTFTVFPVKWKRKLLKMHSCGRGLSHSLVFVYIWGRD